MSMSLTTKSPRRVALAALAVGKEALADYSHPCSPKTFTQPQLFACLVLMVFERLDYRGIEAHLADLPGVRAWIGLKKTPDHSTLHKAAKRFFGATVSPRLLAASVHLMMGRPPKRRLVRQAAADSTGFESGHRSPYFVRRRQRGQKHAKNPLYQTATYTRFPKLTYLIDCATHQALALLTGRGPKSDVDELGPLLAKLPRGVTILKLLADAGFDSEPNHELCRNEHGIASLMPATHGRPPKNGKRLSGYWRRRMKTLLRTKRGRRKSGYTQRWQAETTPSMIKRNLTDELAARSYHAQNRELRWVVITHNIMILIVREGVFDRAIRVQFLDE